MSAVRLCVFKIDTADKVKVMANFTSAVIYFTPGCLYSFHFNVLLSFLRFDV